ncbi:MAG: glycosyltransferase family 1 protein [Patescibacteria group bacterium]|jgi:glycosyltransferase involved in cell wall biosynthesis
MTIGIDASRAAKKNKTGVEWYAFNVIKQIVKTGQNNVQFVLYFQGKPNEWLRELEKKENVEIKQLRWPFKFLWTQGRLSLEMLLHAPDVLFIPASAMPIIHPKNTITTIHDVGFMKYPEAYGKWQLKYLKWSTKFAIKHASKIITISEFSKNEIIKYFKVDSNRIFVTLLACDTEKFRIINDQEKIKNVLAKYKIDAPYILFVGRLEEKKNIIGLLESFSLLKERGIDSRDVIQKNIHTTPASSSFEEGNEIKLPQLVLAGSKGYSWDKAEELIKKNNLQNNIILTGYLPEEDLPYLYNDAELFLFPGLYEGFGMPILEAMACGTTVITSNTTSCPEVGGEAVVYVNPDNYKEIAEVIKQVLEDNNLRQNMIKKGLERVKEFSWEKCGKETLEIFMN